LRLVESVMVMVELLLVGCVPPAGIAARSDEHPGLGPRELGARVEMVWSRREWLAGTRLRPSAGW
jgi:hypothetical protein